MMLQPRFGGVQSDVQSRGLSSEEFPTGRSALSMGRMKIKKRVEASGENLEGGFWFPIFRFSTPYFPPLGLHNLLMK